MSSYREYMFLPTKSVGNVSAFSLKQANSDRCIKSKQKEGEDGIFDSFNRTVSNILCILEQKYGLDKNQAEDAIRNSPLDYVFQKDYEMAAHTSNETWAKYVFEYWSKNGCKFF